MADNSNIIDRAYEVFSKVQRSIGAPVPDEADFVGGFIACFGILAGKVDIGLDRNAPLDRIYDSVHKDIAAFGQRMADKQAKLEAQDRIVAAMRPKPGKLNGKGT